MKDLLVLQRAVSGGKLFYTLAGFLLPVQALIAQQSVLSDQLYYQLKTQLENTIPGM